MLHKPVRSFELVSDVKSAAEDPAGLQRTTCFAEDCILVRECVKAVERQNDIKAPVRKGSTPTSPRTKDTRDMFIAFARFSARAIISAE